MSVLQELQKKPDLVALPNSSQAVLNELQSADTDMNLIAKNVESDPILSIKILKTANSPIFATREIKSISNAVMILGKKRLYNIVLALSIYSKFFNNSKKSFAYWMERFYKHSHLTGLVSRKLAEYLQLDFNSNEYIGGLLHIVGKMILLQIYTKEYSLVRELISQDGKDELKSEKKIFEENHIEVGILVAKMWKLPPEISRVIAFYRFPEKADKFKDLVSIVSFSEEFVNSRKEIEQRNGLSFDFFSSNRWEVLLDNVENAKSADFDSLSDMLDMEIDKAKDLVN